MPVTVLKSCALITDLMLLMYLLLLMFLLEEHFEHSLLVCTGC